VAGETIDYGPCAFMDVFHPGKVFSSIDHGGRYAWGNQPNVASWNLARFAEALLPLLDGDDDAQVARARELVNGFAPQVTDAVHYRFAQKLGIAPEPEFIQATFQVMTDAKLDFTGFFTALTRVAHGAPDGQVIALFADPGAGATFMNDWRGRHDPALTPAMAAANPVYIPRNHRVEAALTAAEDGDFAPFETLLDVLSTPFDARDIYADFETPPTPEEVVPKTYCGT
ncbi:MAG: protein adenylyltransferase SelO family protein, partial [Pseudomonadota bacterium]